MSKFRVWEQKDYMKDYRVVTKCSNHWILATSDSEEEIEQDFELLSLSLANNLLGVFEVSKAFELIPFFHRDLVKKQHDNLIGEPHSTESKANSSSTGRHLEGYLLKRGGFNTSFRKRYFKQVCKIIIIMKFQTKCLTIKFHSCFHFYRKELGYIILI